MQENNYAYAYAVEVHDLTVAYGAKPVLWDIDLGIPKGKLAAIIGPNGAGKTTLIKAMVGLIKPVSGGVDFHDVVVKNGRLKSKIAYVPQSGSVDWDFPATVLDVVMMGRYGHLGWFKRPGKTDRHMALETLQSVGMREYATRQISQLSGGQQQRVFLARALIQQAEIYFMDEPFKGVDAQTEKTIVELLKKLKGQGKTVVLVHHDLQTVSDYFDWVTLINLRIVANGPVEEIYNEEHLSLAYGNHGLLQGAGASPAGASPKAPGSKAPGPAGAGPKAPGPAGAGPKAVSPKAPGPAGASPKAVSPKAVSPKAVSPSPVGKR